MSVPLIKGLQLHFDAGKLTPWEFLVCLRVAVPCFDDGRGRNGESYRFTIEELAGVVDAEGRLQPGGMSRATATRARAGARDKGYLYVIGTSGKNISGYSLNAPLVLSNPFADGRSEVGAKVPLDFDPQPAHTEPVDPLNMAPPVYVQPAHTEPVLYVQPALCEPSTGSHRAGSPYVQRTTRSIPNKSTPQAGTVPTIVEKGAHEGETRKWPRSRPRLRRAVAFEVVSPTLRRCLLDDLETGKLTCPMTHRPDEGAMVDLGKWFAAREGVPSSADTNEAVARLVRGVIGQYERQHERSAMTSAR